MTDFHIADPCFPSHRFPVIYAPAKIAAVIILADPSHVKFSNDFSRVCVCM
jgi:hypothetical protein